MWNLFRRRNKELKVEQLTSLVSKINAENERLHALSHDELRNCTKELAAAIEAELLSYEQPIISLQEQIDSDRDIDEIGISQLYTEIENKRKEKHEQSEIVLKKHIPLAYAILKNTCHRFSSGDSVRVIANLFDVRLSEMREYISIERGEAIYRTNWIAGEKEVKWNMIPYDSQLIAGMALQDGKIAEMLNGEGKTLSAIFPAFLYSIAGRKVHICTANPFLSARDCQWMRPILEFHSIYVSEIDATQPNSDERREAYRSSIVYGTSNEFGFDYLRDKMVHSMDEMVQSELDFVMIDEVDSILIDEARIPLIISGPAEKNESILEQFGTLKPIIVQLIHEQSDILEECFEKAKELVNDEAHKTACKYLYNVKLGNPNYYALYYYVNTTPNIISGLNKLEKDLDDDELLKQLEAELFFTVRNYKIELTEKGRNFIEEASEEETFWDIVDIDSEMKLIADKKLDILDEIEEKRKVIALFEFIEMRHNIVEQLIKACVLFVKDVDYIVVDGSILRVDENTGRALEGRTFGSGVQQAIQAKENVRIDPLTQVYGTISLQAYFQKYRKLAGMTATAKIDEQEYKEIYGKHVIQIPPFKPTVRKDLRDVVYRSKREKLNAIVYEIKRLIDLNRPVLVGTMTVEDSELISEHLAKHKIQHNVLNAKQDELEALIIAKAGISRTVTIAAMMAGRGTDIKLTKESLAAGGLAVLGFERHETRRLDHQLKGRAGRQGDPGTAQFFVSLEDNLMRSFGSDSIASLMQRLGYKEGDVIQHSMIDKSIERAQRKMEEYNLASRNRLFEYDNTLDIAREGIYQKRTHALSGYRVSLDIRLMFDDVSQNIVRISGEDYNKFTIQVTDTFNYTTQISPKEFDKLADSELGVRLYIEAYQNYMLKAKKLAEQCFPVMANIRKTQGSHIENVVVPFSTKKVGFNVLSSLDETIATLGNETVKKFQATAIILIVDEHWKRFLRRYDRTKEDISLLTAIEKIDPLLRFKRDIGEYYMELLSEIYLEIVNTLCMGHISISTSNTPDEERKEDVDEAGEANEADSLSDTAEVSTQEDEEEEVKSEFIQCDEIFRSKEGSCFQINGKDNTGRKTWYFMLVRDEKQEAFLTHHPGDIFDITEYGSVIASGHDETVPEELRQFLMDEYGFDNL